LFKSTWEVGKAMHNSSEARDEARRKEQAERMEANKRTKEIRELIEGAQEIRNFITDHPKGTVDEADIVAMQMAAAQANSELASVRGLIRRRQAEERKRTEQVAIQEDRATDRAKLEAARANYEAVNEEIAEKEKARRATGAGDQQERRP